MAFFIKPSMLTKYQRIGYTDFLNKKNNKFKLVIPT